MTDNSSSQDRTTEFGGVLFSEGPPPVGVRIIQHIKAEKSRQNANLTVVKESLANQARALGANAVYNYRYGQKAHSVFQQAFTFKWDTEGWHAEGDAASI